MNLFSKYSINMPNILFPQDNGVGICSNDPNFTKNISRKYIPQLIKEANKKGGEDVWFYLFHYKSDMKLPFGVALESMRIGMAAKLPTMGDNWLIIRCLVDEEEEEDGEAWRGREEKGGEGDDWIFQFLSPCSEVREGMCTCIIKGKRYALNEESEFYPDYKHLMSFEWEIAECHADNLLS